MCKNANHMINKKRVGFATLLGAFLGVFCILGASGRIGGCTSRFRN
ncbi:MAG: hypothetical protein ACFFFB_05015 [Candidatus Heimdallarchaeota archaeon]